MVLLSVTPVMLTAPLLLTVKLVELLEVNLAAPVPEVGLKLKVTGVPLGDIVTCTSLAKFFPTAVSGPMLTIGLTVTGVEWLRGARTQLQLSQVGSSPSTNRLGWGGGSQLQMTWDVSTITLESISVLPGLFRNTAPAPLTLAMPELYGLPCRC